MFLKSVKIVKSHNYMYYLLVCSKSSDRPHPFHQREVTSMHKGILQSGRSQHQSPYHTVEVSRIHNIILYIIPALCMIAQNRVLVTQ